MSASTQLLTTLFQSSVTVWILGTVGKWFVGILRSGRAAERRNQALADALTMVKGTKLNDLARRGMDRSGFRVSYEARWDEKSRRVQEIIYGLGWLGKYEEAESVIDRFLEEVTQEARWIEEEWQREQQVEQLRHIAANLVRHDGSNLGGFPV